MDSTPRYRFRFFRTSLRARVALGVALPILLVLIGVSMLHYWRERQLARDQIQLTVLQVGEVMLGSLRHAMLANDPEALAQSLNELGEMATIQQVQIVDRKGQVKAANSGENVGLIWRLEDRGCVECHQYPAESRPHAVWFSASAGVLRISMPIENEAECVVCHQQDGSKLGVLLADISVVDIERHLRDDLWAELMISLVITLLITICTYLVIHWVVVQRVESLRRPLFRFAAGDFTIRLPAPRLPTDELGDLVGAFNEMADELQRRARERDEREALRQQAIAEERGRIARELHDGLAQLLGYVNTKAMAVRLMLQKGELEIADQTLLQLEEAARGLFVDVRDAIADLKLAEQKHVGLAAKLEDQVAQFRKLNDIPVNVIFDPEVTGLSLPIETKAHLASIVQEALNNAYKHASASRICINLHLNDLILEMRISDDGQGFDLTDRQSSNSLHFGLGTMRERAREIGAEFSLDSHPGAGTCVVVRLPLYKDCQSWPEEN